MDSSTINICSCSEPVAILRNKIITTKLATGILTFILYIPIWFYSNRNNLQKYHALRRYFTFQSGSILIERQSWIFQVQLSLYIPIWFYSNNWKVGIGIDLNNLYIPIWFYSNGDKIFNQSFLTILYIPIWFYSNGQTKLTNMINQSTLHSNLVLF